MRLDKFVMNALMISRNDARKVIKNKDILVNNEKALLDYNTKADDIITYLGNIITYKENIYIMMNKPVGYLCANFDNFHKTVFDLMPDYNRNKLSIVGRLDLDSKGLLLITSDGNLVHNLTSPKKKIRKTYLVSSEFEFEDKDISLFSQGILIYDDTSKENYLCKSAMLKICKNRNEALITIEEGKFHQVKKMCEKIGKRINSLKRISIGSLFLDEELKEGTYRELQDHELDLLFK